MFKKGDKVVCVDISVKEQDKNSTTAMLVDMFEFNIKGLILNKIYTIFEELSVDNICLGISLNNGGVVEVYMPKRFKLLTEVRKEKLTQLMNIENKQK